MMGLAIGVGCTSTAEAAELIALIETSLSACGQAASSVRLLATIEHRAAHPAIAAAARHFGAELRGLTAATLSDGVAEPAAQHFGRLLLPKQKSAHATCAIAELNP
jgi:cobalamin biosynthesis protein CbiG